MPKVKVTKSRVHHKAVGNKEVAASAASVSAKSTPATAATTPAAIQLAKEQLGLELEDDRIDKKDKRKLKHDKWISKLEATYNPQKKKKKSKKNQLSVNFESFHDVLSTLESKPEATAKSTKGSIPSSSTTTTPADADRQLFTIHAESSKPLQSKKAKKKAAMQEILRFQNVLAHPAFRSNPLQTIQQHVKNTMEMAPPEASTTNNGVELMED